MRNSTFAERYPVAVLIALVDIGMVFVAALIAYYMRHGNFGMPIEYRTLVFIFSLLLIINCIFSGIYGSWRGMKLVAQLGRQAGCWMFAFVILLVMLVFAKQNEVFSRMWLGLWMILGITISCLYKGALYAILKALRKKGHNIKSVAVIGSESVLQEVLEKSADHAEYGFHVVRTLELSSSADSSESLEKLLQEPLLAKVHEIWICLPLKDGDLLKQILQQLRYSTAEIRYFPDFEDIHLLNHKATDMLGMYALDLSCSPMAGGNRWIKRAEDVLLGSLIGILILPLCLLIAIAVKATSRGPVLFKQVRHGIGGKKFKVYKFRTMQVHRERDGQITQAKKNDARLTPIGAFLRRTSLDELPQFYNVLQGSMSIVGPRPHAIAHNDFYKSLVESYFRRHKVKSGITGWAQINGYRGETDTLEKMQKRVEYDLWYIENWSLWLDLKIIFLTLVKGFVNKNAY